MPQGFLSHTAERRQEFSRGVERSAASDTSRQPRVPRNPQGCEELRDFRFRGLRASRLPPG